MAGGRHVTCPATADDELYGASVIRVLKPGTLGLHVHAGNEFVNEYKSMKGLSQQTQLHDQLSFFVVLQVPERGGELCLYDLEWGSTPDEVHTELYPHFSLERDRYFESIARWPITPQVGDLIFFAGGRIWHQVCPFDGKLDRITMGGFTSFSHDDHSLYFWS
ncbi:MAG: 2OG-Fe(II) oxygenase [Arenicella sp.]|nr:2OG-Fe(II) oxygenase [Arenicella sp.]